MRAVWEFPDLNSRGPGRDSFAAICCESSKERFPFFLTPLGRLHKTNMWNLAHKHHERTFRVAEGSLARHPHHPELSSGAFNPASTRIPMDSSHKARLSDCLFNVCSVIFYIIQACFPSLAFVVQFRDFRRTTKHAKKTSWRASQRAPRVEGKRRNVG